VQPDRSRPNVNLCSMLSALEPKLWILGRSGRVPHDLKHQQCKPAEHGSPSAGVHSVPVIAIYIRNNAVHARKMLRTNSFHCL